RHDHRYRVSPVPRRPAAVGGCDRHAAGAPPAGGAARTARCALRARAAHPRTRCRRARLLLTEVEIHYTRPPGRTTVFRQHVVQRTSGCVVTLLEHTDIAKPIMVRGVTVLEPGAPVVWFTFPGLWHDVGRFHTAAGRFTGFYANVLTPVRFIAPTH